MTAPIIPADDFRGDNAKLIACIGALLSMDADGALVPHGIGGHARSLLAAAAARIPAETAPAIGLELVREAVEVAIAHAGPNDGSLAGWQRLLALIDGQAAATSPVAQRKLRELQAEGYIVNGVAIFNPTTGRRGLVDYLGYVGWLIDEQANPGRGPDEPYLCEICSACEETRVDAEGIGFCDRCWDETFGSEQPTKGEGE